MDPALQAKLLKVLEEKKVRRLGGSRDIPFDVRIVAAVNEKPQKLIREGRLREDLYYRLGVIRLTLPPLRERLCDIGPLADYFIEHYNRKLHRRVRGLSERALRLLRGYAWPGNVRELRNVLEFCAYLTPSGVITELSLPENLRTGPTAQPPLTLAQRTRTFERAEILRLLERNGASLEGKKKTAAQLGISLASLYNKLNMQF